MVVAFFSRGRGRGHAIPDMSIADQIRLLDKRVDIRFISYATGAETMRSRGIQVIDLCLSEDNRFLETLELIDKVLREMKPSIVISHEEFAAITAARLHGIPVIFISAWLPSIGTIAAEAVSNADGIVVLEKPGIFALPDPIRANPIFTGRMTRKMACAPGDGLLQRQRLGISSSALHILVLPGGWATEERVPIADTVLSAYVQLSTADKALTWVSSSDAEYLRKKAFRLPNVTVVEFSDPIERLIVACDVVITKATRGATSDASILGVPSISISAGTNPIDDILISRFPSNIALNLKAINGEVLAGYIEDHNAKKVSLKSAGTSQECNVSAAIYGELCRLSNWPEGPQLRGERA